MRKLAKSRRYQGLLLLCLPGAHIIFYFPMMADFVNHVFHGPASKSKSTSDDSSFIVVSVLLPNTRDGSGAGSAHVRNCSSFP